jgi:hypothetical protein
MELKDVLQNRTSNFNCLDRAKVIRIKNKRNVSLKTLKAKGLDLIERHNSRTGIL